MDQLSFCIFPTKHGPQMEQKQTAQHQSSLNIPHCANLRRDCRELLHFTCVNLDSQKCFSILLQQKRYSFAQYLFQFHIGHTKMRFTPVKLRNFCRFRRGLKRQFFDGRRNRSKCLKNLKLPVVRQKKVKALMLSLPRVLVL